MSIATIVLSCLKSDLASQRVDLPGLTDEELSVADECAKRRLLDSVFSKEAIGSKISDGAKAAALDEFVRANQRCKHSPLVGRQWMEWEEELYGSFKEEVRRFFEPAGQPLIVGYNQAFANGSLGRGSNIAALGTDFYTKLFASPLSYTSETLYDAYRRWLSNSPLWSEAENTRRGLGFTDTVVTHSVISFAPKKVTVARVVGKPASLSMYYQQGIGMILREGLHRLGIDLATQPDTNRALAQHGSIYNGHVTIDLRSASDTVACWLVRDVVPRHQIPFLEIARERSTVLPDGTELELNMWSGMGNGYTFPLQTALFSCMVIASCKFAGVSARAGTDWSVFGDDIICRPDASRYVIRLLEMLNFQVNHGKSFVEGPFRESCGADYIYGHDVRPVYLKRLSDEASRYVAINKLVEWSAKVGIKLPSTLAYLLTTVRWRPVPWFAGYDAGLRVPIQSASNLRLNKNGTLTGTILVQKKTELKVLEDALVVPRGQKSRRFNTAGLILAALRGDVRGRASFVPGTIGVRGSLRIYSAKRVSFPSWDGSQTFAGGIPAWQRWVAAATQVARPG